MEAVIMGRYLNLGNAGFQSIRKIFRNADVVRIL